MRLTKRTDLEKGKPCFFEEEHNEEYSTNSKRKAINKLGKLEDIEEKLGIDFDTLFKALWKKYVFIKTPWGIKKTVSEGWNPSNTLMLKDGKLVLFTAALIPNGITGKEWLEGICLSLEDYGKTWALTEEELK